MWSEQIASRAEGFNPYAQALLGWFEGEKMELSKKVIAELDKIKTALPQAVDDTFYFSWIVESIQGKMVKFRPVFHTTVKTEEKHGKLNFQQLLEKFKIPNEVIEELSEEVVTLPIPEWLVYPHMCGGSKKMFKKEAREMADNFIKELQ